MNTKGEAIALGIAEMTIVITGLWRRSRGLLWIEILIPGSGGFFCRLKQVDILKHFPFGLFYGSKHCTFAILRQYPPLMEVPHQIFWKFKGSINKMDNSPDFREGRHAVTSQALEDVSAEIKGGFLSEVGHAQELAKFVEPLNEEMPDALESK